MRAIGAALAQAISGETTTLAMLWRVIRADGVALGFAAHDRAIIWNGLEYRPAPGLNPSAIEASGEGGHAMEIAGALTDEALSAGDLDRGLYDGADVTTFLVDWARLDFGAIELASGRIGDVETRDGAFTAELRTPLADLRAVPIELVSPECRARLGDRRCRVDLARYTSIASVEAVEAGVTLALENGAGDAGVLRYGRLRVLTGMAAGDEREIVASDASGASIAEPINAIAAGDRVELRAGCDKRFATCRDTFSNAPNFRGEPHVPGADAMYRYGGL